MANKKIATAELDYDSIRTNLKTFLQGQTEFQDYDFEGSAMAVLLDLLAYNTHYNSLYKNLAVNESFLDSASKRSSVVSRAKEIGYVPFSATAATAVVDIVVTGTVNTPLSITLPAYSQFSATVDGISYTFQTIEDVIAIKNLSTYKYTFTNVNLKEGTPLTFKYTVASGQKYIVPNENVDLSTLKVRVQDISTGIYETYKNQESILNVTNTDAVFYVKEIEGQLYELEFGNGVIGKALANGNIVNLTYLACNKSLPNGARTFIYQGTSLTGSTSETPPSVTCKIASYGGSDVEDIDSIRFNAPRAYNAQNRAVTVDDYKSIIFSLYPRAQSINVWGGEDNNPPVYGKVFISIKPYNALNLTEAEKDYVNQEILKNKNVVSITPVLTDATYINLEVTVNAYYNPNLTSRTSYDLQNVVLQTIVDYNDNHLNKFDGIFRYSKVSSSVDACEDSIVSNIITIKLRREVVVKYNTVGNYLVNLGNPIYNSGVPEESIITTGFYIPDYTEVMYLEDLPVDSTTGTFRMFYYVDGEKIYVNDPLGTIYYSTGIINISNLQINGIYDTAFEFIIKPQSNDVVSIRDQLVSIPESSIIVNMILDQVSLGNTAGNTNYTFSSSRN